MLRMLARTLIVRVSVILIAKGKTFMLPLLSAVFGLCGLVGWIWIVVIAFQSGEIGWGIGSVVCGIVAIVYGAKNFEKAKIPLGLLGGGMVGNILVSVLGAAMGGGG